MSYFRPFSPSIITQNINHRNIIYLYRGHSASTSIWKGREKTKRAAENDIEERACSQKNDNQNDVNDSHPVKKCYGLLLNCFNFANSYLPCLRCLNFVGRKSQLRRVLFLLLVSTHIHSMLVFLKKRDNEVAHSYTDHCTGAVQNFNLPMLFFNTLKYQVNIKFCRDISFNANCISCLICLVLSQRDRERNSSTGIFWVKMKQMKIKMKQYAMKKYFCTCLWTWTPLVLLFADFLVRLK